MAIRSSSGFSHLWPGVFHISLKTHQTQQTNTRVEEKRTNKHELGLAPSARREKFVTLFQSFLCIYELSQACIRVKFPQSPQERWLILSCCPTQPLVPQDPAVSFPWLLLTDFFCWLPCSVLGPSFLFLLPVSWKISHTSQNRQRDPLTGTHTYRNEWHPSYHIYLTNW